MKEWTREERYRTILEASNEELTELRDIVNSCPYRQKFHIQPTTGLLNDPNGFSYYNNEYHLFYQWFHKGSRLYDVVKTENKDTLWRLLVYFNLVKE